MFLPHFLIRRSLPPKSAFTVDGLRLPTPLVVSPETFSGVGLRIDTAGGCPFRAVSSESLSLSTFSDWHKTSGPTSVKSATTTRKRWDFPSSKQWVAFHRDLPLLPSLRRTVGPTLGGYLSKPEENFPGLAKQFPILRDVAILRDDHA